LLKFALLASASTSSPLFTGTTSTLRRVSVQ
jgi:hypothetical protein